MYTTVSFIDPKTSAEIDVTLSGEHLPNKVVMDRMFEILKFIGVKTYVCDETHEVR